MVAPCEAKEGFGDNGTAHLAQAFAILRHLGFLQNVEPERRRAGEPPEVLLQNGLAVIPLRPNAIDLKLLQLGVG